MKRLFFLFLFSCICCFAKAQQGYIFTEIQHEQIKRNLADYRLLIKEYDVKSKEFEKLKREFEILFAVNHDMLGEYLKLKNEYNELKNNNTQLINVLNENKSLKSDLASAQREILTNKKQINMYKSRYERELKKSRGDRIIANSFFGVLVGGAIISVFYAIEENY